MLTKDMDLRYRGGGKPKQLLFVDRDPDDYSIISLHSVEGWITHQPDGKFNKNSNSTSGLDLVQHDARSEIKPGQVIAVRREGRGWYFQAFRLIDSTSVNGVVVADARGLTDYFNLWRFLTPEELGQ